MRLCTVYYISINCSTCFGWYTNPSSGANITNYSIWHWPNFGKCSVWSQLKMRGMDLSLLKIRGMDPSVFPSAIAEGSRDGSIPLIIAEACPYLSSLAKTGPYLSSLADFTHCIFRSLTSARCCNYSYMCSWWWVTLPPGTCRAVYRNIINCT
jgi:hypothetical protein